MTLKTALWKYLVAKRVKEIAADKKYMSPDGTEQDRKAWRKALREREIAESRWESYLEAFE